MLANFVIWNVVEKIIGKTYEGTHTEKYYQNLSTQAPALNKLLLAGL